MNARFDPWFGGCRHFLRPGTTKLPLFRGTPLIGGDTRNWLDVVLYAATQLFLLRALVAAQVTPDLVMPIVLLIPAMAVLDKMLFLVCRAEHYFVVIVCLAFAAENDLWISGAKLDLVLHLVLGRHLEAQPPFPVGHHVHDEQRTLLPEGAEEKALHALPRRSAPLAAGNIDGALRDR